MDNRVEMFTENDIRQMREHGLGKDAVERQMDNFRTGFPYFPIVRAASVEDGTIMQAGPGAGYAAMYDEFAEQGRVVKFVPASGAATRMFKDLYEYLDSGAPNKVSEEVLSNIGNFAFGDRLKTMLPPGADGRQTVSAIVGDGLWYGSRPKALILFHKYKERSRTALEEHLVEGALYAACAGKVSIHFTVSPEHRKGFEALLADVLPWYEGHFGVKYEITMSEQKSSTDTIAVDVGNVPLRDANGSLVFRPAGHGALIENLNDIDADIIFIKNIDNVTTDALRGDTVKYKKILAGVLLALQERVFAYMRHMETDPCTPEFFAELHDFVENELHIELPEGFGGTDGETMRVAYTELLDKPIRVCGMVRNEGEPGGGPFMARNADGTASLQIVEPSQVAPEQRHLMKESTHFNPVDLVCGVKDNKGRKFDLRRYVDHSTGFISVKSKDGRELKAQELPGLWNGAMSKWTTVFVEVPVSTFTPVKVVTDLLRTQHR